MGKPRTHGVVVPESGVTAEERDKGAVGRSEGRRVCLQGGDEKRWGRCLQKGGNEGKIAWGGDGGCYGRGGDGINLQRNTHCLLGRFIFL